MSQAAPAEERRLNSWKEIAAYFGNDQRTVKRWENTRGLPVRRLPGARSGVFALVSEIEAWQRGAAVTIRAAEPVGAFTDLSTGEELQASASDEELASAPEPAEAVAFSEPQTSWTPKTPETVPVETAVRVTPVQPRRPRFAFLWQAAFTAIGIAVVCSIALWHHEVRGAVQPLHVPLPRARELYLQGRFLWNKRTPDSLKAALADFEEAAKIDPQYAAAFAGIADCYALSPQFDPRPGSEVYPRMLTASKQALALDESSPEGHRALAFALFYWDFDTKGSRAEFAEALRLAPHDATTHLWFANTLATSGMFDQSLAEIEQAREIDPASPSITADRAWILYRAHRWGDAFQIWTRLEQTDPDYTMVHTWLAGLYLDAHEPGKFLEELQSVRSLTGRESDAERLRAAQTGLQQGGEQGMCTALAEFEEHEFRRGNSGPYGVAVAMLRAGRNDKAIDYLDLSYRTRDGFVPGLALTDIFAPLHGMPRFQELVAASERSYKEAPASQANLRLPISTD